ncbi:metal-sulfur cluster assembly factor [Paenibacillus flagellatus]|uniref:FeS assembly SUF system protein n=1 Tax=Paenibacillus flagellatus TaxID=2211139 RepID=A0A2V5KLB4_9BACL|nr:iron-sulfur cluster assembly protein [Paenibacillus flagellatus]PYI55770.1 FeS assembly SUF system protein [Paenibacillus flagellatus]
MDLKERIWTVLEDVLDPEVHVNIVDMGLVYEVNVDADNRVSIEMTLTVPECPMKDEIVEDITEKIGAIPGVRGVDVKFVWEPKWTPARMNDAAIEEFKRQRSPV